MSFSVEFLGRCGSIQDASASNTSIILRGNEGSVLIDVSGNLPEAVGDGSLKALILTHEHIDHIYALPSLLHQLWLSGRSEKLMIAASKPVLELASEMIDLFSIRKKKGIFEISMAELKPFSIAGIDISPFKTDHTSDSYGIIAACDGRTLIYTSDTRPIHDYGILKSADVLISETSGLHSDEEVLIRKGHQSGVDAASLAIALNAERLYIVHLPADDKKKLSILEEARSVFPATEIPELLRKYEI